MRMKGSGTKRKRSKIQVFKQKKMLIFCRVYEISKNEILEKKTSIILYLRTPTRNPPAKAANSESRGRIVEDDDRVGR